jgi:hypothetical protein
VVPKPQPTRSPLLTKEEAKKILLTALEGRQKTGIGVIDADEIPHLLEMLKTDASTGVWFAVAFQLWQLDVIDYNTYLALET